MFPFKIRYHRTIKTTYNSEQINDLLDISRDILSKKGAIIFSRDKNRLEFEIGFSKSIWTWETKFLNICDSGFAEILPSEKNYFKVIYGVTLIRFYVILAIISQITLIFGEILFAVIIFCIGLVIGFPVLLFGHYEILHKMTQEMHIKLQDNKK
jgi:hypothetical protein